MRRIPYIGVVLGLLLAASLGTPAWAQGGDDNPYNAFSQPPGPAADQPDRSSRPPADQQSQFAQPAADQGTRFTVDLPPRSQPPQNQPQPRSALAPFLQDAAKMFTNKLSGGDLQVLSSRDVIVLVDKSGSMSTPDCPAPGGMLSMLLGGGAPPVMTRWQWCELQLNALTRQAAGALPGGIRLVLFDSRQYVFDHVGLADIPRIFDESSPQGGTHEAEAVESQLDWYFARRTANGGTARPVVIAVITDGLPNSASALRRVLVDATRKMSGPGEVAVTFLQIGNDRKGVELVHDLSQNLVRDGATYPIVHCEDFGVVSREGLARALIDAINEGAGTGMAQ